MIASARRRGALVALVVVSTACGHTAPTTPTAAVPSQPRLAPGQPPPRDFPPLTGPSRTFAYDHALSSYVQDYTKHSQFILYDTGGFLLKYTSLTGDGYRGGYMEAGGAITFDWEGWSVAGPWAATGTLKDGVLTVRYNDIMQWTDFEDAAYRLTRSVQ